MKVLVLDGGPVQVLQVHATRTSYVVTLPKAWARLAAEIDGKLWVAARFEGNDLVLSHLPAE